jgi:hypothetical protein
VVPVQKRSHGNIKQFVVIVVMFGSILTANVSIQMLFLCSFLSGFNFVSLFGDDVAFGKPGLLNSEQLLRFEY